jgi:23S rRNA pseudouridine1911/1915/1917 synthase
MKQKSDSSNQPKENQPKENQPKDNQPKGNRGKDNRGKDNRAKENRAKENRAKDNRPNVSQYTVNEPTELLLFLLHKQSKTGRNAVKAMLARGQVSVDDRVAKEYNHPLVPGQTVKISREKVVEEQPLVGLSILHEDDDLIVIQKQAGLLSIASAQETELTAYRQLMAHVRSKDPKGRVFVVHRLDRDTSGVMMFAKSEKIQQSLQNAWQEAVKERTYVALVEGKVKKQEGTISSWLRESSTLKMYSSHRENDGQHAVTHYKVVQGNSSFSLLEVRLETGRKNQIRVHMEDIGHPIVGDKKYGSKSKALPRLGLHARVLAFIHPTTEKLMRFETEIPKSFLGLLRS